MNAVKKETKTTQDLDELKIHPKSRWMTGNYSLSPAISKRTRSGFSGSSTSHPESGCLMPVVVQRLTPSYEVDVLPRSVESLARSLAESQAEAARCRE